MSDVQAHLLVVDDDERIRGLLQKFLIRSGLTPINLRRATMLAAVSSKSMSTATRPASSTCAMA